MKVRGDFWEPVFFYHVVPDPQTRAVGLGSKSFYPPSLLTGLPEGHRSGRTSNSDAMFAVRSVIFHP